MSGRIKAPARRTGGRALTDGKTRRGRLWQHSASTKHSPDRNADDERPCGRATSNSRSRNRSDGAHESSPPAKMSARRAARRIVHNNGQIQTQRANTQLKLAGWNEAERQPDVAGVAPYKRAKLTHRRTRLGKCRVQKVMTNMPPSVCATSPPGSSPNRRVVGHGVHHA